MSRLVSRQLGLRLQNDDSAAWMDVQ
jgi:hypothetical protein